MLIYLLEILILPCWKLDICFEKGANNQGKIYLPNFVKKLFENIRFV